MSEKKKGHEDQRLIAEAQRSSAAYAALYQKYQRSVFRFFKYRLGNVEDAWDYMQETFVRAFASLKKFNDRGYSYLTYLLRIARNLLVDHYRKPATLPLEAAENIPDRANRQMELNIEAKLLWQLSKKLSPEDQGILTLYYRQRKSIREIAYQLQQTENAVKLRLSRARKKLRSLANQA